jgi:cell division protein FtsL
MLYNVLVVVVLFVMVFMLAIQIQLGDLNVKMQETIKKVDRLINERLQERSNIKLWKTSV